MAELQTMPLRFRVYDKEDKKFLITPWVQDGYELIHIHQTITDVAALIQKFGEDRLIISQGTGLVDKTGKHVFTGDIIEDAGRKFIVGYERGEVKYYPLFNGWLLVQPSSSAIIGNIFENPELMGEEK